MVLRRGTPKRGVAATVSFVAWLVGRITIVADGVIAVVAVVTDTAVLVAVAESIKV
jgi:hypothetical protein